MKKIVVMTMLALTGTTLWAQKKEMSQARDLLKSGAYGKAEKLMTDLLARDSASLQNARVYALWLEAVRGQYAAANEKMYLKQKYDTVAFYDIVRRMQLVAISLDSLDMRPDSKGRVRPEYRKDNAEMLNRLRPNIFYGGTFHVRRGDYDRAFLFFDTYIDAARQPLFTGYDYAERDQRMAEAAYWATLCGFKLGRPDMTLAHSQLALKDGQKAQFTLHYMCEAYRLRQDTERYVKTLSEGFSRFPRYPYFFPRLADYYTAEGRHDSVLVLADRGLSADADSRLFLLAKSVALLHLERYDECISVSRRILQLNDAQAEAYLNLATCYLNQALVVESENEPRKNRERLEQLYSEARPYMERYRELAPADKNRWAPALYRIYLNLNMGKQFDEIDRLLRN